jgi:pyrroline-5-carboxylate reductase
MKAGGMKVKTGGRARAKRRRESPPKSSHGNTTVFLGGGRITGALLAGLRLAKYQQPIIVYDRHPEKLRRLHREYGVTVERDLRRAVEQADLLFIAVRPDAVDDLLQKIKASDPERINPGKTNQLIVVSLAAGIPLSSLRGWLTKPLDKPQGKPVSWARAMPSPVARSGRGLTALTFGRGFPAAARRHVRNFFAQVGAILEISESRFDAFSVAYSSSQGYHALSVLAEAAQMIGLDRRTAMTAAAHALGDGIQAWRDGSISLDELLQEAATPGGVAAATLATMEKSGYRRSVQKGLRAGLDRTRRYAKR